jgi:uncharacterized membrane protein
MIQSSTRRDLLTSSKVPIILLLTGIVGLIASFILTVDKIRLLQDPSFVPACRLNPIVSCLSAMSSAQSQIGGVPNSLAGIMLYTALIVISVLLLMQVSLPRIVWQGMLGFCLVGILFVHYLIIQSLFVIHVICPWCLSIWLTTPLLAFALLHEYQKHIGQHEPSTRISNITSYITKQRVFLGAMWYAALMLAIGIVFRDYWATLL